MGSNSRSVRGIGGMIGKKTQKHDLPIKRERLSYRYK